MKTGVLLGGFCLGGSVRVGSVPQSHMHRYHYSIRSVVKLFRLIRRFVSQLFDCMAWTHLHADDGVDEEQHGNQQDDVWQRLSVQYNAHTHTLCSVVTAVLAGRLSVCLSVSVGKSSHDNSEGMMLRSQATNVLDVKLFHSLFENVYFDCLQ